MLVVADINTLWRRRPFQAMSELRPVLGLEPMDPLMALKRRRVPWGTGHGLRGRMNSLSVVLPFGWATRKAGKSLPQLWAATVKQCRAAGAEPSALIMTSPHYLPLVHRTKEHVPMFYYCSDDYAQYEGWGGEAVLTQEKELVREVAHSFFVSEVLAERALRDYGVTPERVSVSPNATDDGFLKPMAGQEVEKLLGKFKQLMRPLVGVVGGINERLDFQLLLECAALREIGTLVMVGPIANDVRDPALSRLQHHPRCVFVGPQPHAELPAWMQSLDVALIPYRRTPFNRSCSPMRLFDHLASGRPIVATDACQQVLTFKESVDICGSTPEFVRRVVERVSSGARTEEMEARRQVARANLWSCRAQHLAGVMRKL